MEDFLEVNRVDKIRTVGFIVALEALIFTDPGKAFPGIRMSLSRAMAGFALDIHKFSAIVLAYSVTGGVAG